MSNPLYGKNLSQTEKINNLIDDKLSSINTVIPCEVTGTSGNHVSVQPLIKRVFIDASQNTKYIPYGVLTDVPVLTLGSSAFNVSLPPPSVGDKGVILISENSINDAYSTGEVDSIRRFDLADAIYVPLFLNTSPSPAGQLTINSSGKLVTQSQEATVNATGEISFNAGTDVKTTLTGSFKVSKGPIELINALVQVLTTIAASTVSGVPLDNAAAITAAIANVEIFL